MTSRVFLLAALCGALLSPQAQTLPAPDRLALGEMVQLAATHPSPKALVDVAQGHPVALVHGRATVGFIGRLGADVSESEWRSWAEANRLWKRVRADPALPPSGSMRTPWT